MAVIVSKSAAPHPKPEPSSTMLMNVFLSTKLKKQQFVVTKTLFRFTKEWTGEPPSGPSSNMRLSKESFSPWSSRHPVL